MTGPEDMGGEDRAEALEEAPPSRYPGEIERTESRRVVPLRAAERTVTPSPVRPTTLEDVIRELRHTNAELRNTNSRIAEVGARQLDLEADVNRKFSAIMDLLKEALGRV